jgi:hypothetical protein
MTTDKVFRYWFKHYYDRDADACTLCGGCGFIDTTETAITGRGVRVGKRQFCICSNGRAIRKFEEEEGGETT